MHGRWKALRTEVKDVVRSAKQKLWKDQMHSCNNLFHAHEARSFWLLLRWRSSGACPPPTANHVAMTRTPAGHTVCSDVGITSAFAHHYARLGEPSPVDTADFDAEHMRYVRAQVAQYTVRSHDPRFADSTLDAVPSRDEIAGVVEKLRNHKAGTEEGIVNEMLKYGGPAILDMLAGLVETLWSTELVPGHWRAGDIVNIFKKGDKKDPGNYRGITLLNMVGKLYTKVIDSRLSAWLHTHHGCSMPGWLLGASAVALTMYLACRTLFRSATGRNSRRGCFSGMRLRPLILFGGMVCLISCGT